MYLKKTVQHCSYSDINEYFCTSLTDGPWSPQLSHALKGTKTYSTKHRAISQNLVDLSLYSGIRVFAGISQHSQQSNC